MNANKYRYIALVVMTIIIVILSLLIKEKGSNVPTLQISPTPSSISRMPKKYAISQVALHNTRTDCWMVIEGKVYEVTSYVPNHNPDIVQGCGKEATALFEGVKKHAGSATSMLNEYLIGTLQN